MARVRKPTKRNKDKKTGDPIIPELKSVYKSKKKKKTSTHDVGNLITKEMTPMFKEIRNLVDSLQERQEAIKGSEKSESDLVEINQKHISTVNSQQAKQKVPVFAEAKSQDYLVKGIRQGMSAIESQAVVEDVLSSPTDSDVIKEWQTRMDKMKIRCAILTPRGHNMISPRATKAWSEHEDFLTRTGIDKVLRLGNVATDFVPHGWSMELLAYYYAALQVGSIFDTFPMPYSPFTYPIIGEPEVYYRPEPTASNRGNDNNEIVADDPDTGQITFTARKITARIDLYDDLVEDAVDMMLDDLMRVHIPMAMKRGVESALINGDRRGTHQDNNVTATNDVRKAWQGVRRDALERSATFNVGANNGTFDFGDFSRLLEEGSYYFDRPEDCCWLLPTVLSHRIKRFDELETLDKYTMPTNYHGHVGYILGMPVFTSAEYPMNLDETGVVSDTDADNVHTGFSAINHRLYRVGERRIESVGWHYDPLTQYYYLVSDCRKDFQPKENRRDGFTPTLSAINIDV